MAAEAFHMYVRTEFCLLFLFLFLFLAPNGPVGVQICPCYKAQVQTCRLVAIGTFDPGPDGADVDSGPVAFKMYKKKKKKKKKPYSHVWSVCQNRVLYFFFFFFFFFLAPNGPGIPLHKERSPLQRGLLRTFPFSSYLTSGVG